MPFGATLRTTWMVTATLSILLPATAVASTTHKHSTKLRFESFSRRSPSATSHDLPQSASAHAPHAGVRAAHESHGGHSVAFEPSTSRRLILGYATKNHFVSGGRHHLMAENWRLSRMSVSYVPGAFRWRSAFAARQMTGGGLSSGALSSGAFPSGGLQCVAFAREASGIALTGNAVDWWENAAGLYLRGHRPEVGAVLNFRANGRMRLGHVAVVTEILDSRTVQIDHANWSGFGGTVSRAIEVIDVSPSNDWSAVRVQLGHTDDFGSIYPTYGFIYNRPEGGPAPRMLRASIVPVRALNPPPADLRPPVDRLRSVRFDEVAEAPESPRR